MKTRKPSDNSCKGRPSRETMEVMTKKERVKALTVMEKRESVRRIVKVQLAGPWKDREKQNKIVKEKAGMHW